MPKTFESNHPSGPDPEGTPSGASHESDPWSTLKNVPFNQSDKRTLFTSTEAAIAEITDNKPTSANKESKATDNTLIENYEVIFRPEAYPEDLIDEHGNDQNPWNALVEIPDDEPTYTIDQNGVYHYKQAAAMNRFQHLANQARKAGNKEKADYYNYYMRRTAELNPIYITTDKDKRRLSIDGELNYYRTLKKVNVLFGNKANAEYWQREYEEALRRRNASKEAGPKSEQSDESQPGSSTKHTTLDSHRVPDPKFIELFKRIRTPEQSAERPPFESRIHFHMPLENAKQLASAGTSPSPLNVLSKILPEDMKQEPPYDCENFILDFYRKHQPEKTKYPSGYLELYKDVSSKENSCVQFYNYGPYGNPTSKDYIPDYFLCKSPHYNNRDQFDCSLRLCPQPESVIPIIDRFVRKCEANNLPYQFLLCTLPDRNEKLIISTKQEMVDKYLAILEEIQDKQPVWFEGAGRSPLWSEIDKAENIYYTNASFHSKPHRINSDTIYQNATQKWQAEFQIPEKGIKSSEITDQQAKRFREIFAETCREAGINPKHFTF